MKKILFSAALFTASFAAFNTANAQISVHVNIGRNQPQPAPVAVDNEPAFYYYPGIDVYLNIASRRYMYRDGNRWVNTPGLPPAYRNYDMNRMQRVPMPQRDAYLQNDRHRQQYAQVRNDEQRRYAMNGNRDNHFGNTQKEGKKIDDHKNDKNKSDDDRQRGRN